MTNQELTIQDFIDDQSADAKKELYRRDSGFVVSVPMLDRTQKLGFVIPSLSDVPVPTQRLGEKWRELLAMTTEVVKEQDKLLLTILILDPERHPHIDRLVAV